MPSTAVLQFRDMKDPTQKLEVRWRDVESIIRDLVEAAINIVGDRARKDVEDEAHARARRRERPAAKRPSVTT